MGEKLMARNPMWRRYLRFFGPDVQADVDEELSFHLDNKIRELVEKGRSPAEAEREALRHFGNLKEVTTLCRNISKEHVRKVRWTDALADWGYDVRHAMRSLRRAPVFAMIAVAILAAGMAGTASLFSMMDAWVLQAVRFAEPRQLVYARSFNTKRGSEFTTSFADYEDFRARARQMQSLAAWGFDSFTLSFGSKEPGVERIMGATVSANFLETLRVQPFLGRDFLASEADYGRNRVAIVSHGFWKARLNSDKSAIGSTLRLDGEDCTIIGVLPEDFHFTLVGRANIFRPLAPTPEERSRRQSRYLTLLGRMRPGVTVEQAKQELLTIAKDLAQAYPDTNLDIGSFCISLSDEIARHTGANVMWIVFAITIGLLLIACSNVANLLLVRALARQRQASIQLSLGASRARLIRQSLVETLTLFVAAASAGTVLAWWLTGFTTSLIPYENRGYLPNYGEASLSLSVLAFVLGVALLTAIIFGLAPAFESVRTNVVSVLKESGSAVSQSPRARRIRTVLVTGQIAMAAILLAPTALLVQSFRSAVQKPLGFDPTNVLTFKMSLDEKQYPDAVRRRNFFDAAADAVTAPTRPALARYIPFGGESANTSFRIAYAPVPDVLGKPPARFNAVSPEFFAAMKTPLLAGRAFAASDSPDSHLVAIVNEPFVAQNLAGRNPIGQHVILIRGKEMDVEIVGVIPEIKIDPDPTLGKAEILVPFAQAPSGDAFFLIRGGGNVLGKIPEIRRRLAAIDARQPLFEAVTLEDRVDREYSPFRIISGMLIWFGLLALALTAVGVYGVVAFSVSQRTREIGIRSALGADRKQLLGLFLKQGLVILAAGLVPGLAGAFAATIGLKSALEGLASASVDLPLALTAIVLGGAVLVATWLPARRAAGTDPLAAIRYE